MQVRANENGKIGTCGCGRSPTGDCCGWHALTEDDYRQRLAEYSAKQVEVQKEFNKPDPEAELENYRQQALDMWFKDGSCTGGKSE
jgi:hypothetical protein